MLTGLIGDHVGTTVCAYLDVPFDETLRRHESRPQSADFTPEQMAGWFEADDRLHVAGEIVIGQESTTEQTVETLLAARAVTSAARRPT
jgi:hypothetical protein